MATTTMLMAKEVGGMGSVVTDDKGMTLYRYDMDQANPSKWTCAGECTKTWMPVMVEDSVQTTGVEKSLLGTVHRDGMKQLTLGGWPLYRYMGDTQAGQMNGQAKDKMWYAVTPSGKKSIMSG
jgi:predicted lipoprotein with Yx(FWY)xxD motif